MGKVKNIVGNKYGSLTVVSDSGLQTSSRSVIWVCKCDCGNITNVRTQSLNSIRGGIKSCGKCKVNIYHESSDGYMIGKTTDGRSFYFDKEHLKHIERYNWCFDDKGYVVASNKTNGKYKHIKLHKLISSIIHGDNKGYLVDHINRVKYDNRTCNLRLVTAQINIFNRAKRKGVTSKFKGVSYHKQVQKWRATIGYNYKSIYLGLFDSEKEASEAYNIKAYELYGS